MWLYGNLNQIYYQIKYLLKMWAKIRPWAKITTLYCVIQDRNDKIFYIWQMASSALIAFQRLSLNFIISQERKCCRISVVLFWLLWWLLETCVERRSGGKVATLWRPLAQSGSPTDLKLTPLSGLGNLTTPRHGGRWHSQDLQEVRTKWLVLLPSKSYTHTHIQIHTHTHSHTQVITPSP